MFTRALPLLFAGLSLTAVPHHGPQGGHGHGMLLQPFQALNLSEAQKTSIHQVFEAHKPSLHAKAEATHAAHRALIDGLTSPATTDQELQALHAAFSATSFELVKEGRAIFLEIDPLLAPEQRVQAQEVKTHLRGHLEMLHGMLMGQ